MIRRLALMGALLAIAAASLAQEMDPNMPGMTKPAATGPAQKSRPPPAAGAIQGPASPPKSNPSTPATPAATMPGMTMLKQADAAAASGTASAAGNAPAPPPPTDHYAERSFGAAAMAASEAAFSRDNGGQHFSQIMLNLAELQLGDSHPGYRWDGEGWFGGDINRLVVKSEGDGASGQGVGDTDVQALYSRAVGPYFNLQAGLRQSIEPTPQRTYGALGFEGLAPYWFEVEGALFLSNRGDLLARLEGYYDQNLTQRLILQPRVELNFAAQDVPQDHIGSGLSDAELGLRLRYEIRREFAPYIGVSWQREVGRTAVFTRAEADDVSSLNFVLGIRAWL